MKILLTLILFLSSLPFFGQTTRPTNGAPMNKVGVYAFTNATIHINPTTTIKNGTLLVKNGEVVASGLQVKIPLDAHIINLHQLHIYPSFIDMHSDYGIADHYKEYIDKEPRANSQFLSHTKGAFGWNEAVRSELKSSQIYRSDITTAENMRSNGFGYSLSHVPDGIFRGTGSLIELSNEIPQYSLIQPDLTHHLSFSKGSSSQSYPNSLMGRVALIRQTFYDAKWYQNRDAKTGEEINLSLEALKDYKKKTWIIEGYDKYDILRAAKIAQEFELNLITKVGADVYQRLNEIKASKMSLIVSPNFPEGWKIEDEFDKNLVSYSQLLHWQMAPSVYYMLDTMGIPFVMSAYGIKGEFLPKLRAAVKAGLSESSALKSLTTRPAQWLGNNKIGSLEKGKRANFFIATDNIFLPHAKIIANWTTNTAFNLAELRKYPLIGNYTLAFSHGEMIDLELKINPDDNLLTGSINGEYEMLDIDFKTGLLKIQIKEGDKKFTLIGFQKGNTWSGNITGDKFGTFKLTKNNPSENSDTSKITLSYNPYPVPYPFKAYGWTKKPSQENYLIQNITVWTNTPNGILEKTDVRIKKGKIVQIGKNLSPEESIIINGQGKHLTTGIIDEHSHIAISKGVNEGTQASSAEVSIGDVVNPDNAHIFRHLAGGVTAMQLLHGSANPIGGQSALIKLRWGMSPEEMKIKDADGFIKFALGENVKQSNWGPQFNDRFPQTRMGVEQVYYDHFWRAKAYLDAKKKLNKKSKNKFRIDLELEVLGEILQKKRFITCHSYVQSEINMLMKVADSMGFKVNTFTHILEGYKVADKMHEHGVGASTFADWWAYKYEVIDAIPYNAAILNDHNVVTAINSDDAEMGRRLNQEAAKIMKYGGVSKEDAWKMVTLNPAILLHLDQKMGKIEIGYDADLVIWSTEPLSIYAKAEKTWVDGRLLFDRSTLEEQRNALLKIKNELIDRLNNEYTGDAQVEPEEEEEYHCDDLEWKEH